MDFDTAITNSLRMLKRGGRFRLVVPDLEGRVRRYGAAKEMGRADASDRLMREMLVGLERRPRSLMDHIRAAFGNSAHLWMWDYAGIHAALENVGFVAIRCCQFGDSGDAMFDAVEREDRFFDELWAFRNAPLEARRP